MKNEKLEEATMRALVGKLTEDKQLTKIWEVEKQFVDKFNKAVDEVADGELTLREVLDFGFNNVSFEGTMGYEPEDFTEEQLNKKVKFVEWDFDNDGYRFIVVK